MLVARIIYSDMKKKLVERVFLLGKANLKSRFLKMGFIRHNLLLLPLCLLINEIAQGQHNKETPLLSHELVEQNAAERSLPMTVDLFKTITHSEQTEKWAVSVRPTFSRDHSSPEVAKIKESKKQAKLDSYIGGEELPEASSAFNHSVGSSFEANWVAYNTPPDNSMAISNGGYIVSAENDGVQYYSSTGNLLFSDLWSDFFNDNTLTGNIFDPRVIYDSGSDRFILVVLHGNTASTSKVLICFSITNNPQNGWYVYQFTGNPLSNNCWFDFPSVGVSNNEVYVTGNLFTTASGTPSSFNQAVIYQIPKWSGYAGNSISWQYWSNLSSSPFPATGLVPASYGHQGNYGPGIFFVSNHSNGDSRIRLWDLTDDMSGNPTIASYTINTATYSLPPNALQMGSNDWLENGDCRIQSAFYLNGLVHFVFHSDIGGGWNGIIYNRLATNSLTNQSASLGLVGSYDNSYPSVASFSTSVFDKTVAIAFLRSSPSMYPQVRVVTCDNNMQWSSSTVVKTGETFVNTFSDIVRWGDYTGISRRHNSGVPRIWLSGHYGANIAALNLGNRWKTWIAEIYGSNPVGVRDEMEAPSSVEIFPNPTYDLINIRFTTESTDKVTIEILDLNGKVLRTLFSDALKNGENNLTFNKGALSPGTYLVRIAAPTKVLKNEKIIILG